MRNRLAHRLRVLDDFVERRRRHPAHVLAKAGLIQRSLFAQVDGHGQNPTVAFLAEQHATARIPRRRGHDQRVDVRDVLRAPFVDARGVVDADLDGFFLRAVIAQRLQPGRAARAAPGRIDDQVGAEALFGAAGAASFARAPC